MKKTFKLTHEKIQPARQVEAIKFEVRKYIRRERNKKLPENVDFWDFDCRFGDDSSSSKIIHLSEINKAIDIQVASQKDAFYLEILAKPGIRVKNQNSI